MLHLNRKSAPQSTDQRAVPPPLPRVLLPDEDYRERDGHGSHRRSRVIRTLGVLLVFALLLSLLPFNPMQRTLIIPTPDSYEAEPRRLRTITSPSARILPLPYPAEHLPSAAAPAPAPAPSTPSRDSTYAERAAAANAATDRLIAQSRLERAALAAVATPTPTPPAAVRTVPRRVSISVAVELLGRQLRQLRSLSLRQVVMLRDAPVLVRLSYWLPDSTVVHLDQEWADHQSGRAPSVTERNITSELDLREGEARWVAGALRLRLLARVPPDSLRILTEMVQ